MKLSVDSELVIYRLVDLLLREDVSKERKVDAIKLCMEWELLTLDEALELVVSYIKT